MEMMPHLQARIGVAAERRGGKQVLPAPLRTGPRILSCEPRGQRDAGSLPAPLFLVPRPQAPEMRAQRNVERGGQHRDTVVAALRLAHDELTALELDVPDPQSQRLHEKPPPDVEQA